MRDNRSIAGELGQCDEPNWEPLLTLLGEELVSEFMWMSQVDLTDGNAVHAYKHARTRRYLHIGEDGRTRDLTRSGRYRPAAPRDAVLAAFDGWEPLVADPAEAGLLRAALDAVCAKLRPPP